MQYIAQQKVVIVTALPVKRYIAALCVLTVIRFCWLCSHTHGSGFTLPFCFIELLLSSWMSIHFMFIIKWIVTRVVAEEVSSVWFGVCGQCHDLCERAAVCFCPSAGVVIKERRLIILLDFFFVSVQCERKTGAVANLFPSRIMRPLFFW